jgi:hypothetical protein
LYISGHDHNLQLTDGQIVGCKTLFAISGAGASTESLTNRNQTLFDAEKLGYMALTIGSSTLNIEFLNERNETLFKQEVLSPSLR